MASRHENPGRVPNDNFLKTLYKISTLFSDFPWNHKWRCSISDCIRLIQFKRCITACLHLWNCKKSRSHFTFDFQTNLSLFLLNLLKKRFRCNLFQVASKALNKHGGTGQIWTGEWRFCRPLPYHLATSPYKWKLMFTNLHCFWSGRRGSNSLPPPWQGGALPDELRPQDVYSLRRIHKKWCLRSESNQWHGDFQSPALPTELQRQMATRIRLELTTSSVTG